MSSELVAVLEAQLSPRKRDEVTRVSNLAQLLVDQLASARDVWRDVRVADENYACHLGNKIEQRADEPADHVVVTMPSADLYLAAACAAGDPIALAAFQTSELPSLREALGKLGAPPAEVDEALQRVLVMLFVGHGAQIAQYSGRGRLRSWVRSIGIRTVRRMIGTAARDVGDGSLSDIPVTRDPELELLRARYATEVREAFSRAVAALTERQRNVLRQYYADELTIDQLAGLYQIHRASAARWVAGARLALVTTTRQLLVEELHLTSSEATSIIRVVRSQLSISLRDLA